MKKIELKKRITNGLVCLGLAGVLAGGAVNAVAADGWRPAFEDICSRVQATDGMSIRDLQELIERSDKLMPEIQASGSPAKKIYLRRLKRCRSMYQFMIDTKKGPGK